jgi:hypothetical protein
VALGWHPHLFKIPHACCSAKAAIASSLKAKNPLVGLDPAPRLEQIAAKYSGRAQNGNHPMLIMLRFFLAARIKCQMEFSEGRTSSFHSTFNIVSRHL